jgi:hypothetical protein
MSLFSHESCCHQFQQYNLSQDYEVKSLYHQYCDIMAHILMLVEQYELAFLKSFHYDELLLSVHPKENI